MAKIVQTTRNGDTVTTRTNDAKKIKEAEDAPFKESSNIAVTRVTEIR